jgi:hypothetical protein
MTTFNYFLNIILIVLLCALFFNFLWIMVTL